MKPFHEALNKAGQCSNQTKNGWYGKISNERVALTDGKEGAFPCGEI